MSAKAKRLIKKIISWSGIFFFIIAVGMLYWQLRNYSLSEIINSLLQIPFINLVWASVACLLGYVALSFYDYLALRYVGKMVSWWKWMLAGMLGFAISNNAGHAVVSGGAIRYRLYTRWRINAGDIVKMLTFKGFTYCLGCSALVILGYFLVPRDLFADSVGVSIGLNGLFIFCLVSVILYFAMTIFFRNKVVKIGEIHFQIPKTKEAFYQMLIGMLDTILAGMVLYFCLIPFVKIPITFFIGVFVISQVAGVFSQVPAGIGVFESIFLLALPSDIDRATVFGVLLAYRIIYNVLPLIGAGGLFFIYENWLRVKMKKWAAEASAFVHKLPRPKIPKKLRKK